MVFLIIIMVLKTIIHIYNVHEQKLYITMITETLTNIGLAVFTCYYKYLKLYIILILFPQFTTSTILLLYINLETIACTYTGFCFYICLLAVNFSSGS